MPSSDTEVPLLSRLFRERIEWRFGCESRKSVESRYQYESKSCFLLDNIHYVDSKRSLFNQVTDILLFVIMKTFYYEYLRKHKASVADIERVPVDVDNFNYFICKNSFFSHYDENDKDVMFIETDWLRVKRDGDAYVVCSLIQ